MAIIIFCAKLLGLLREVMIAGVYGQGYSSDILNTATQIPILFFDMTLGVAILSTFVPVFNKCLETKGKKAAMEFANNFMTVVVTLATAFSLLGVILAEPLVKLMVPGYDAQKIIETAKLLRVLFPSVIFTATAYTSVGILQSFGEFNIPSIISVVSNLVMILYLVIIGNKFGLLGVAVSMVLAWAMQLVIQIPHLFKFGYRVRPKFNLKDEGIISAAKLALPVLISSWVQPLCVVINMAFGSSLGDGAVSGLNWANKIYIIMVGIFAYAVTNFIFPKLSRLSAGEEAEEFSNTTKKSVMWVVYIIGYVLAMFIALSRPIIRIVFERGAFTAEDTLLTASALRFYSVGMIGYAICEILNKSFYAAEDGKTPMITSICGVAVNFVSAFIFVRLFKMGVGGLALASAVSSNVMAVILVIMLNKLKAKTFGKAFLVNLLKVIAASAFSAVASGLLYSFIGTKNSGMFLTLCLMAVSFVVGLVVYIAISVILKTDEVKEIRRLRHGK